MFASCIDRKFVNKGRCRWLINIFFLIGDSLENPTMQCVIKTTKLYSPLACVVLVCGAWIKACQNFRTPYCKPTTLCSVENWMHRFTRFSSNIWLLHYLVQLPHVVLIWGKHTSWTWSRCIRRQLPPNLSNYPPMLGNWPAHKYRQYSPQTISLISNFFFF